MRARTIDVPARLVAARTVPHDNALLVPLVEYARGHATGIAMHFRAAFRPTAHVEGVREGEFVSWDLDGYCANFAGTPARDEPSRRRTITEVGRTASVAHATMVLEHGPDTFTDIFLLVEEGGIWRIANKVYHRGTP